MRREALRLLLITYMVLAFALTPVLSSASWLDNWYAQKTSSGPSYYSGQERGYWTAGSFSARTQTSMIYPISVASPSLSMGCGGIDFFGGGVALQNFQYLVKKLQGILSSSAAVAFDMALDTLCPECSKAMKSIESIANQLNSAGLDSCKAGKAIVSFAADKIDDAFVTDQATSDRMTDYQNNHGLYDSYQGWAESFTAAGGGMNNLLSNLGASPAIDAANTSTGKAGGANVMTQGCPQDFQDIFTNKGSLLNNLAMKLVIPTNITDAVRGAIGDYYLVSDQAKVVKIPICSNPESSLEDVIDGKAQVRGPGLNDSCVPVVSGSSTFRQVVTKDIQDIANTLQSKGSINNPVQMAFINNNPMPVVLVLKAAIGTQTQDLMIATLADVTAKAMAYRAIRDIQGTLYAMLQYAHTVQGETSNDPNGCSIPANVTAAATQLQNDLMIWQQSLRGQLQSVYAELLTIQNVVANWEKMQDTLNLQVARRFGASVARRAMQR